MAVVSFICLVAVIIPAGVIVSFVISRMFFLPLCMLGVISVYKVFFFFAVTDRRLIMLAFITAILLFVFGILQVRFLNTVDHYLMTVIYIIATVLSRQLFRPAP